MKKLKYSAPFDSRDYFTQNILPTAILADQKTIRKQIPYRQHDDLEILLIRQGSGTITVNAVEYPVTRGDLFCFSPYHFHRLDAVVGDKLEVSECHVNSGVYFYVTACPYYHTEETTALPYPHLHVKLSESQTRQVEYLLDGIAMESAQKNIQENQSCFFLLMKLFGIVERCAVKPDAD